MAYCDSGKAVKVVHIETQYVETDPLSFKSVVQSLTGKDSCLAGIEKNFFGADKRSKRAAVSHNHVINYNGTSAVGCGNRHVSVLSKGMSFKDLDGNYCNGYGPSRVLHF